MNPFLTVELGIFLLFIISLIHSIKYKKFSIILLSFIYAIIFENLNIYFSQEQIGGYFYNESFNFFIFNIPLFIIMSWSIIIYTAILLTDLLPIKEYSKPFIDSLLIILIDLAIDVIAIRLYLWTWINYSFNEAWFGVPSNNFIGWLLVAFTFSLLYRNLSKIKKCLVYLIPILSYLLFLIIFIPIKEIETLLNLSKNQQLLIFLLLIIIFISQIRYKKVKLKTDKFTLYLIDLVRFSYYIFALLGLILLKVYLENIIIVILGILFIFLELSILKFTHSKI
jgi:uncharacterized membrane protein